MARARMIDVDYYSFRQLLKQATDRGGRIEKRDTERWNAYIKEHKINEVGARAIAATRFDSPTSVIIALGGEGDGLYVYSDMEEGCLRLVARD
ncbi:MAG: hypothetical protein WED00_15825 [Aquisalimonadaceae bacterium]